MSEGLDVASTVLIEEGTVTIFGLSVFLAAFSVTDTVPVAEDGVAGMEVLEKLLLSLSLESAALGAGVSFFSTTNQTVDSN